MFQTYEDIERAIEFAEQNNLPRELIVLLNKASESALECINREIMHEYSFADFEIENAVHCKTIHLPPF